MVATNDLPIHTKATGMIRLMEETQMLNPVAFFLRPHHALCVLFFEGKGYSQAFIENMAESLAKPSQLVQITDGCDTLCQACPHNHDGLCRDEAKVSLFDQRILSMVGEFPQAHQPIPLNELCQSICDSILKRELLAEVCGECEWAALCQDKWQRGDFNRQLLLSDTDIKEPL